MTSTPKFILLGLAFFLVAAGKGCKPDATFVYPDAGSTLSGYQDFLIGIDRELTHPPQITFRTDDGIAQPIASNTIRLKNDGYRFLFCVECVKGKSLTLSVAFPESELKPLDATYSINHEPELQLQVQPSEQTGSVMLDASTSKDPEGKTLEFEWQQGLTISKGSTFLVKAEEEAPPILMKTWDGTGVFYTLVTLEMRPQPDGSVRFFPKFIDEKLKCDSLEIVDTGASLLHPSLNLGPVLKKDDQVELKGNKPKKNHLMVYRFEVRATIVPNPTGVLLEGQDVAATSNAPGDPSNGKKKGTTRKSNRPQDYNTDVVDAPYPDNPSAQNPPTLVQDSYEFHPAYGIVPIINPNGELVSFPHQDSAVRGFEPNKDFRADNNGNIKLTWFDSPGFGIKTTMDLSTGASMKAFFKAWMDADAQKCTKYFTIVMEIDKTGKVIKSELTRLN